jgi:transposase-like protein
MGRGRPPKGSSLVDGLEAPSEVKKRLKVILETLSGALSVAEACKRLGVSQTRLHELRQEALRAAAAGLEPKQVGRPRKPAPREDSQVEQLEQEIRHLRLELRFAQAREEIAMTMPHVLVPRDKAASKKKAKRKTRKEKPG